MVFLEDSKLSKKAAKMVGRVSSGRLDVSNYVSNRGRSIGRDTTIAIEGPLSIGLRERLGIP